MKVLIIEDDKKIITNLAFCLEVIYKGVTLFTVRHEQRALDIAQTESLALVILDVTISGIDIIALIRKIREHTDVPIIIIGDASTDMDIAVGLEAGADEYISKQFNPIELIARLRALLRRCRMSVFTPDSISINGLTINFKTHEVLITGQLLKLTPTEYRLLSEMIKNKGKLVPTNDLLDRIWGTEYIGDPNLVKTYIYRLRSKIKSISDKSIKISSERGMGYRLIQSI